MKNNDAIIMLVGLVFLFLLIGIAVFTFFDSDKPQITQSQANTVQTTRSNSVYQILAVDPPQDDRKKQLQILQIDFVFNDIVNPKTFYYDISPKTATFLKTRGKILTLYPKDRWPDGTITITIASASTGAHGGKLGKPYVYKFTVETP